MATARSVEPVVTAPPGEANVVLIGAGFAGLEAAKQLAGQAGVHLTIIDRHNYHLFQPLLYQVATATLEPGNIAAPIRAQFTRARNVEVHLGVVDAIDVERNIIEGASRQLAYDYLIVAAGASHPAISGIPRGSRLHRASRPSSRRSRCAGASSSRSSARRTSRTPRRPPPASRS
jgi:NADPH-dependent 2,4-dienoyl-CoA reductase/sulfur reductase-like enzyme